jgi:hypothetical protein
MLATENLAEIYSNKKTGLERAYIDDGNGGLQRTKG